MDWVGGKGRRGGRGGAAVLGPVGVGGAVWVGGARVGVEGRGLQSGEGKVVQANRPGAGWRAAL